MPLASSPGADSHVAPVHPQSYPRAAGHGRVRGLLPIVAAGLIGVGLSVFAGVAVSLWEARIAKLETATRAHNQQMFLQNGLNEYLSRLAAMRAFFEASDHGISRSEFKVFAEHLLEGQGAIRSVSWIPRIADSDRAAREREAVRDGVPGYHIKSVLPGAQLGPAGRRDEYFPIYYSTEDAQTSPYYGIDLGSEPMRLETLDRARDTGQMATSKSLVLNTTHGAWSGFFVLLPLYQRGQPHATVEERRRHLIGFVQGAFQTDLLVETILTPIKSPLDLYVFAAGAAPTEAPLHVHASHLNAARAEARSLAEATAGTHWLGELKTLDGRFTLVSVPIPGQFANSGLGRFWIVLTAGLSVSALVMAYMLAGYRHARNLTLVNRKVYELAQLEPLTGLANRRAFLDHLAAVFAQVERGGSPFAVLYLDLDHFKDVNDTLGHAIGDELLRQVAARITEVVRQTDLVSRFGGDEFAVLLSNVSDPSAAGALAGTINAVMAEPYMIAGNELHVTASIGISSYSEKAAGPADLLIQADLALYRAKEDGRNCFRFHSEDLDRHVHERVKLAEELRLALDRAEFELHYQPQVELASGRIVGVEALVRWNHPKRGFIPASVFIPVAERTGQILALNRWVFDEACRQGKAWLEQGIAPRSVAVNISALQFRAAGDLENDIAASLTNWRLPAGMMEIELTESVLMEATQHHTECLKRLRNLGLTIAIDDFGTGYSSLSYLTAYPVDRLKIAQELMFRVDTDSRNATVVRAAIHLARELGFDIVAEGVETEAQAQFLLAAGCVHAQGYYFARPANAERTTQLLRQGAIKPVRTPLRLLEKTSA